MEIEAVFEEERYNLESNNKIYIYCFRSCLTKKEIKINMILVFENKYRIHFIKI